MSRSFSIRQWFLLFSVIAAIASVSKGWIQEPAGGSSPPTDQTLHSNAELVKLDVSVTDPRGNFVPDLRAADFHVLADGAEQPVVFFAPVEAPVQVVLMLETSPAVYLIHDEHLLGAYALAQGLKSDDQVALVTYDETPHVKLTFTTDRSALFSSLGGVQYNLGSGTLNFYNSVATTLDWLNTLPGKKAIVLLTTGLDMSSPGRWDLLARKLRADDAVVFPIALGGSLRSYNGKKVKKNAAATDAFDDSQADAAKESSKPALSFEKAGDALQSMAKITGGRSWVPESAQEFPPIYREIATQLRNQYILGIAPTHDGQLHSIEVQAKGGSSAQGERSAKKTAYHVYARQGYLAPAN